MLTIILVSCSIHGTSSIYNIKMFLAVSVLKALFSYNAEGSSRPVLNLGMLENYFVLNIVHRHQL